MSFVKLDRKLKDWQWKTDPNMVALWVHLLLEANYKENNWKGIQLPKGTFPTSTKSLSEKTGLSVQQTKTCLKKLQLTNEITIKSTNKYSLITINKWDEYQGGDDEVTSKPTNKTAEKQQTKNPQTNNTIRSKEANKERIIFIKPSLEEVREYCKERNKGVDADRWFNYYSANGWKVGKNPMKDWKASVRTWETNDKPKKEEELKSSERYVVPW